MHENLRSTLLIIIGKSIAGFLIIFFVNYFFNAERLGLTYVFLILFIAYSFLQSTYSRTGFTSRIRFIVSYIHVLISKRRKLVQKYFNNLYDYEFYKYVVIVKIILLVIVTFVFITNFSFFLISNIYYIMIIISVIFLTFILNNLIYFGLVSFLVLRFNQIFDSITQANVIFVLVAFAFVVLGVVIETIFNERILVIRGSRMIKSVDFSKNYKIVKIKLSYAVYQNMLTKQYYVYYRRIGYVIIFDSYFDAKLSWSVIGKMVRKGRKYLIKNNKNFELWL